ncbi:MAG: MurR/RpiR family transcriptional regulator [Polaromonas sp.]|nr:MurR/RpiR family transcriptional regulator [Polaromonas sp.]
MTPAAPSATPASAARPARPASLAELRELIGRESERLTPRLRAAARYALDHPNEVALNPVATLARASKVAAATFIRLAQFLGCDGYSDLQRLFREPLQHAGKPSFPERIRHFGGEQPLDHPDDPAEVLRAFSQANMVSLEHLRADAASLPLQAAIDLIEQAPLVHVVGLRRSYAVAAYLAYALNRVGCPAVQINGLGGGIGEQASIASAGHLLIAVSFPPYAADTLQVCQQLSQRGVKRLALTNSIFSPIAQGADLVLEVNDAELLGFRSLCAAMSLAQTLAMGVAFGKRGRQRLAAAEQDGTGLDAVDC